MTLCNPFESLLAEYVASGEPDLPDYAPLRQHLALCSACQAQLAAYRQVEVALHTRPIRVTGPILTARIMHQIALDEAHRQSWKPLPWSIWVPMGSVLLALVIVFLSIPGMSLQNLAPPEGMAAIAPYGSLLEMLGLERNFFWILWSVIFATLAGLGIRMSLRSWQVMNSQSLSHLEEQVSDTAHRLWEAARRGF